MRHSRSFENAPQSVTAARHFAIATLQNAAAETLEAIQLMVSELASNCVRHTDSRFDLAIIQTAREVRVEAIDCGRGEPRMRSPRPADPSGRGLRIIDMLSTGWG